jgi:thiamine-phosphate pyrophosphorylase
LAQAVGLDMPGFYPIVDMDALTARGIPVLEFARAILAVCPPLLQFRAKHLGSRDTLGWLRGLRPLATRSGTALFANDRPDLALLGGCDGVHLGQEDLEPSEVRRRWPGLRVGISTHSPEELATALAERPDYVAYGPVFPTRSKERAEPAVGLEGLRRAAGRAQAAQCTLVAIGGVDLERAGQIGALGAVGAALSALLPPVYSPAAVTERALSLQRALGG